MCFFLLEKRHAWEDFVDSLLEGVHVDACLRVPWHWVEWEVFPEADRWGSLIVLQAREAVLAINATARACLVVHGERGPRGPRGRLGVAPVMVQCAAVPGALVLAGAWSQDAFRTGAADCPGRLC